MTNSIVLLSGGIDSTTALYWSIGRYENVYPLTFDYGQRHRTEIGMARRQARRLGLKQTILRIDLGQIGGSSLTDSTIPIPIHKSRKNLRSGIPSTYVPFRNGIFLAMAAAWAEVQGVQAIVCGFNVIDSPSYPDTRRDFVDAMEKAIHQGTRPSLESEGIRIIAPFLSMKKSEIIRTGLDLGADYSFTVSCYSGLKTPCRKCSSCLLREQAWQEVGRPDPLLVRLGTEAKP